MNLDLAPGLNRARAAASRRLTSKPRPKRAPQPNIRALRHQYGATHMATWNLEHEHGAWQPATCHLGKPEGPLQPNPAQSLRPNIGPDAPQLCFSPRRSPRQNAGHSISISLAGMSPRTPRLRARLRRRRRRRQHTDAYAEYLNARVCEKRQLNTRRIEPCTLNGQPQAVHVAPGAANNTKQTSVRRWRNTEPPQLVEGMLNACSSTNLQPQLGLGHSRRGHCDGATAVLTPPTLPTPPTPPTPENLDRDLEPDPGQGPDTQDFKPEAQYLTLET